MFHVAPVVYSTPVKQFYLGFRVNEQGNPVRAIVETPRKLSVMDAMPYIFSTHSENFLPNDVGMYTKDILQGIKDSFSLFSKKNTHYGHCVWIHANGF